MFVIALAAAMIGGATMAWFTSVATSEGNTFDAGKLVLKINDNEESFTINFGDLFENGLLQPGDISEEVTLKIENAGTLDLAWFGKLEIVGDLADAVYIDYMVTGFKNADGSSWYPTEEVPFIENGVGAGPYGGGYPSHPQLNVITVPHFNTNNHMGYGGGVHGTALKPGNYSEITFKLGIAPLAENVFQDKNATVTFRFASTQVRADAIAKLAQDTGWLSIADPNSVTQRFVNDILSEQ